MFKRGLKSWVVLAGGLLGLLASACLPAATLTVGTSGTYATMAAAFTAAASGDTIELVSNISEDDNFSYSGAKNLTITSDTGTRIWDGANNATSTLQFANGNNSILYLSGFIMDHSSASGGYVIQWNNSGVNILADNMTFQRTSTSTTNNQIISLTAVDNHFLDFHRSSFIGNGFEEGIDYNSGNNDSVYVENSLFYDFTGGYAGIYTNRNNTWGGVSSVNNTFFNDSYGIYDNSGSANNGARPRSTATTSSWATCWATSASPRGSAAPTWRP